jgi:GAF domain-containing protein
VNFLTIQEKIQALFALPDLKLGIVFFDPNNNIISSGGISDWNSFMIHDHQENLSCSYFSNSIYDKAFTEKKPVIIENLAKYDRKTKIEKALLEQDIKNIIIAPLTNNGEVIGMLELVTPNPGDLNFINAGKLSNVLPMFSAAITRVLGDLHNEVRAAIQKECTAIHPSVEWKFLQAGYEMVGQNQKEGKTTLPEIVFDNVYPLFGMSDIRNSSVLRNQAIREDLLENLSMAKHS